MGVTASAQAQMQQQHDPNSSFPWWVRWVAKGCGVVGGFVAMFFAALGLFTVNPSCIIAVLIQLVMGFLLVALEAPFCCMFVDFIEKIANFSESRAYWQKAVLYCAMSLVPFMMCNELETFLGGSLILASGVLYGIMSLGKKADREAMMDAGDGGSSLSPDAGVWDPNVGKQSLPTPAYGLP